MAVRSAITGRFVAAAKAFTHPKTTVSEGNSRLSVSGRLSGDVQEVLSVTEGRVQVTFRTVYDGQPPDARLVALAGERVRVTVVLDS